MSTSDISIHVSLDITGLTVVDPFPSKNVAEGLGAVGSVSTLWS